MPTVRLRHVGPVPLEVAKLHDRLIEPGDVFEVDGVVLPDVAAVSDFAGESMNFAPDAIHIGHDDGQLLAWPTAHWALADAATPAVTAPAADSEE